MSTADGRRRASEIIAARPEASLREVAREAGMSLGTAHNVRERMRRGEACVPDKPGAEPERSASHCDRRATRRRQQGPLAWRMARERLAKDPALRYAEAGRVLLPWFDTHAIGVGEWRDVIDAIPSRWVETMINVAYSCGNEWYELASALERRNVAVAE